MGEIIKEEVYKIPLFRPYISEKAVDAVSEVLKSKFIGQGPLIPEFENAFSDKFRTKYSVAVNSCTSALHLAYILAGVGPGDEVIGPLLTCSATWHPVLWLGAKPVFVDIDDRFCIDADRIEEKITEKTKAIVVMHYGGNMCDMKKIMDIAKKHNLKVIEDVAQAMGATYDNKYAGTIGDYGAFSFQAIKYFTTVDGGMLTCKNEEDYERAKRIRWFGIDRDLKIKTGWNQFKDWEKREMTYDVDETGYKYHMNNFNAAIGLVHLEEFGKILLHYNNIHEYYAMTGLPVMEKKEGETIWLETVLVDDRDLIAKRLKKQGIETNVVHIRSDVYSVFKPYAIEGDYPNMDKYEMKYLVIPNHMFMSTKEAQHISEAFKGNLE